MNVDNAEETDIKVHKERCSGYHEELIAEFVIITRENITKRTKELCYLINQNKYIKSIHGNNPSMIQFTVNMEEFINSAMQSITPVIKQHTIVQLGACKKIPKSKDEYKKVARNRLNRHKPKFLGNFVFGPIIFEQLYQFCAEMFNDNQMMVFVSILDDILSPSSVVRFEQTRAQPLIPYNTLVMENKFKTACIALLKHYKLAKQWEIGCQKSNGKKKETAKDVWTYFRTVCLPKLAQRCVSFQNVTIPQNLMANTVRFTTQSAIIPESIQNHDDHNDEHQDQKMNLDESHWINLPQIQQQFNDTESTQCNYYNGSYNQSLPVDNTSQSQPPMIDYSQLQCNHNVIASPLMVESNQTVNHTNVEQLNQPNYVNRNSQVQVHQSQDNISYTNHSNNINNGNYPEYGHLNDTYDNNGCIENNHVFIDHINLPQHDTNIQYNNIPSYGYNHQSSCNQIIDDNNGNLRGNNINHFQFQNDGNQQSTDGISNNYDIGPYSNHIHQRNQHNQYNEDSMYHFQPNDTTTHDCDSEMNPGYHVEDNNQSPNMFLMSMNDDFTMNDLSTSPVGALIDNDRMCPMPPMPPIPFSATDSHTISILSNESNQIQTS